VTGQAPLRVLFAGTPDVAVPSLTALLEDDRFEVVGVLTNPDRPRGRRGEAQAPPVALVAIAAGVPVLQPERARDAIEDISALGPDIAAVVAYGSLLPQDVLDRVPHGFLNLHFSLLPRWRGAAPVQHAIRAGDDVTGVSVFVLDSGMDTGPLLRRVEVALPTTMDAGDLLDELAVVGAPVLLDALVARVAGEVPVPQPPEGVTLAPKLTATDATVDFALPASDVARRIRSVSPRPGAMTTWGERRLKVGAPLIESKLLESHGAESDVAPGTVLRADERVVVACGDGALALGRLQLEGRRWLPANEFVRGTRLAPGAVLGSPSTPA
jgi:methionyl-tRNA formyltransferase